MRTHGKRIMVYSTPSTDSVGPSPPSGVCGLLLVFLLRHRLPLGLTRSSLVHRESKQLAVLSGSPSPLSSLMSSFLRVPPDSVCYKEA